MGIVLALICLKHTVPQRYRNGEGCICGLEKQRFLLNTYGLEMRPSLVAAWSADSHPLRLK